MRAGFATQSWISIASGKNGKERMDESKKVTTKRPPPPKARTRPCSHANSFLRSTGENNSPGKSNDCNRVCGAARGRGKFARGGKIAESRQVGENLFWNFFVRRLPQP